MNNQEIDSALSGISRGQLVEVTLSNDPMSSDVRYVPRDGSELTIPLYWDRISGRGNHDPDGEYILRFRTRKIDGELEVNEYTKVDPDKKDSDVYHWNVYHHHRLDFFARTIARIESA